jgi:glucokinase
MLASKLSISSSESVKLINDFEAVAYGVKHLVKDKDILTLQDGEPQGKNGTIIVAGAATGLGKSFLIYHEDDEVAYPTEGGHTNFAPRSELEFALLQYILNNVRDENNKPLDRVSVERIISGRGIVGIYRFLQDCQDPLSELRWLKSPGDEKTKELIKRVEKTVIQKDLIPLKKEVAKSNLKKSRLSSQDKKDILNNFTHQPLEEFLKSLKEKIEKEQFLLRDFKEPSEEKKKLEKIKELKQLLGKFSEPRQIKRLIENWQIEDERERVSIDPAAIIASAALKKSDPLCIKAMQMFLEIYAAEMGNTALQFLPYGGLYMAGGITPQILPLIEEEKDKILTVFMQKGRLSSELKKMPVYIIKNLEAGLVGAAYYAAKHIQ